MEIPSNKLSCWKLCKSYSDSFNNNCNWFSYSNDSAKCQLYETCPEIDETLQYVSGQKECQYDSKY